jgi:aryl-alcohol dehydrogenase-like predicted oxidoreductase
MTAIPKRRLGKTGLDVTEVSLGSLFLREVSTAREEAIRVVHRALELGVNYIDTAPSYGNSQVVLGEALEGRTEPYFIGSKCGSWVSKGDDGVARADWQNGPYRELDAFKVQFEQTLRDLRRDSVDILYIHEADWVPYWQDEATPRHRCHITADGVYDYADAPVVQFLMWAKAQGMAQHLGISGNNAHLLAQVLEARAFPVEVVLVAYQYSLIWRNARAYLLPLTPELDQGMVVGAPLQQGLLAVPHREWLEDPPDWMDDDLRSRFAELYAIQQETELSLAELAMRFLLADQDVTTVIPGAATVAQLEENIACSAAGALEPEIQARLQAIGKVFDGVKNVDY